MQTIALDHKSVSTGSGGLIGLIILSSAVPFDVATFCGGSDLDTELNSFTHTNPLFLLFHRRMERRASHEGEGG